MNHKTNNSQTSQTEANNNQLINNKGLFSLPPSLMSVVPWIPFVLEAMTGQKIPQMSGTMAEIQASIQQIQLIQQQLLTQQQQLTNHLTNLETNASQQLTNLTQQFQSLRLTHTKEHKEIEYNPKLSKTIAE